MEKQPDPRIKIVVKIMEESRFKRVERLLKVNDLRRKDGRFTMKQEAEEIIAALDAYAVAKFDSIISEAKGR